MLIYVIKRAVVSGIEESTDNLTPQLQLSTLAAGSQDHWTKISQDVIQ